MFSQVVKTFGDVQRLHQAAQGIGRVTRSCEDQPLNRERSPQLGLVAMLLRKHHSESDRFYSAEDLLPVNVELPRGIREQGDSTLRRDRERDSSKAP